MAGEKDRATQQSSIPAVPTGKHVVVESAEEKMKKLKQQHGLLSNWEHETQSQGAAVVHPSPRRAANLDYERKPHTLKQITPDTQSQYVGSAPAALHAVPSEADTMIEKAAKGLKKVEPQPQYFQQQQIQQPPVAFAADLPPALQQRLLAQQDGGSGNASAAEARDNAYGLSPALQERMKLHSQMTKQQQEDETRKAAAIKAGLAANGSKPNQKEMVSAEVAIKQREDEINQKVNALMKEAAKKQGGTAGKNKKQDDDFAFVTEAAVVPGMMASLHEKGTGASSLGGGGGGRGRDALGMGTNASAADEAATASADTDLESGDNIFGRGGDKGGRTNKGIAMKGSAVADRVVGPSIRYLKDNPAAFDKAGNDKAAQQSLLVGNKTAILQSEEYKEMIDLKQEIDQRPLTSETGITAALSQVTSAVSATGSINVQELLGRKDVQVTDEDRRKEAEKAQQKEVKIGDLTFVTAYGSEADPEAEKKAAHPASEKDYLGQKYVFLEHNLQRSHQQKAQDAAKQTPAKKKDDAGAGAAGGGGGGESEVDAAEIVAIQILKPKVLPPAVQNPVLEPQKANVAPRSFLVGEKSVTPLGSDDDAGPPGLLSGFYVNTYAGPITEMQKNSRATNRELRYTRYRKQREANKNLVFAMLIVLCFIPRKVSYLLMYAILGMLNVVLAGCLMPFVFCQMCYLDSGRNRITVRTQKSFGFLWRHKVELLRGNFWIHSEEFLFRRDPEAFMGNYCR